MKPQDAIAQLESEWSFDSGFFGKLRQGSVDEAGLERTLGLLRNIKISEDSLPRRFVELIWYIPSFVAWQKDRCCENGYDAKRYDKITNRITSVLEELIGVP